MLGYPKKQIDIGREVILFSYKFTRNSATAYFVFVNKHFKLLKGLGIMSKYVYKIMTLLCGFNKLAVSNTLNYREDVVKASWFASKPAFEININIDNKWTVKVADLACSVLHSIPHHIYHSVTYPLLMNLA